MTDCSTDARHLVGARIGQRREVLRHGTYDQVVDRDVAKVRLPLEFLVEALR
jgi:hypothetical protein